VSTLSDDRKPITDGRRNPLKDVAAPLRDQVVEKLYDKLIEMNVGQRVANIWLTGSSNRDMWLERQKEYLAAWDEHLISSTEGPFDGSSQLHLPMPFIVCKTVHARFYQAIMGMDPPLHVKARNEASLERVDTVRDTMRYAINDWANHHKGVDRTVDTWIWDWITVGSGLMKLRWDVKYTRFVDVEEVAEPGPPKFQVIDGRETAIPTIRMVEREVKRTKKCFEGPVAENVDAEDLLIVGGGGDPDLADAVLHQQWLTASELWTLVDRKVFNKEAVEKIIEGGPDRQEGAVGSDLKQQRATNAGSAQLDTDVDLDRYQIIEAYLALDTDDSGINSEVVVWVHPRSRELLRATYLYRVARSGERPFVKADFHLRKGQEFGTGIPELIYPLTKELDAMHNMRIDCGLISTMPIGFYRASSGIDPEVIQFAPGSLIPVDNPATDVVFPNMGNRTVFGMQEEQGLMQWIERLTGINDMALGMISGAQGATRTATGARALVGEMSANLDVHLRRLNRGWRKFLRYLLSMLQQRCPDGLSFRLTGDDGKDYWRQVKKGDLDGQFDLEVSPNTATSNAGIQQEMAAQILQLTANPLDIQLGIITPAQRYEALRNYLQALGVKDFGRYLQKPQGYQYTPDPESEANQILRGIEVPVLPQGDHEGFIAYWEEIKKHDDWLGQFNEKQAIAMEQQARRHAQMLQAIEEMAAQQANAQQMRTNAAMSQQQVPTGLNAMAGAAGPGGPAAPVAS